MAQRLNNSVTIEGMANMMNMERDEVFHFPFREDLRRIVKDYLSDTASRSKTLEDLEKLKEDVGKHDKLNIHEKKIYHQGIKNIASYLLI